MRSLFFGKTAAWLLVFIALVAQAQQRFNGGRAYEYARDFAAIGPRWPTSAGHAKAEAFLRARFAHDKLEEDTFTADTPIGPVAMRNFIVRFPGKKDGAIVLASHYETNYWLRNINFVGANDGAATTGLLLGIADQLRTATAGGRRTTLQRSPESPVQRQNLSTSIRQKRLASIMLASSRLMLKGTKIRREHILP